MGRNNRAKRRKNNKPKLFTIDETKAIADKAAYSMAKEVMEMFHLIVASWLTDEPVSLDKEEYINLKKHLDRSVIGLLNGTFDKEMYYANLKEKGIEPNEILKVNSLDIEKYLNGEYLE